jgi:hypothetical protein
MLYSALSDVLEAVGPSIRSVERLAAQRQEERHDKLATRAQACCYFLSRSVEDEKTGIQWKGYYEGYQPLQVEWKAEVRRMGS